VKGQSGDIPQIGLGTSSFKGDQCIQAVKTAIDVGFRVVDTALIYGNQVEVGEGIRQSSVPRSQIWITTKVGFFPPGSESAFNYNPNNLKGEESHSIDLSLKQLGVDSIDLILIHNPAASREEYYSAFVPHYFEYMNYAKKELAVTPKLPDGTPIRPIIQKSKREELVSRKNPELDLQVRKRSWLALEEAQKAGKCKYIGVSNFPAELLLEMKSYASVMPAVNQLEFHPGFSSPQLQRVAKELGVVLTGFGTGTYCGLNPRPEGLSTPLTWYQAVARWTIQHGAGINLRSSSRDHLIENLKINALSELSAEDMKILDELNKDYPYYWDQASTVLSLVHK